MKINSPKPRICVALPGINYIASSPYVFSTLPIIRHLEVDFEITLVFRRVLEEPKYNYLTILDRDRLSESELNNSNPYFYPGLFSAYQYLGSLKQFARKYAQKFDMIIEKEWRMLGSFIAAFKPYKIPSIIISEAEFITNITPQPLFTKHPIKQASSLVFEKYLPDQRKKWIKQADSIITETEQMKQFLLDNKYVTNNTDIYPIQNGIDPSIFYPRDRNKCRQQLGIDSNAFVLVYVGSLNRFIQEPAPLIEALGIERPPNVVLHIVGDGSKRKELESIANNVNSPVVFHGKLTQQEASHYIGAANLCIAPYDKTRFPQKKFTSSSLKVIEYLACGRLVMTIPCARMEHLLERQKYGFFVNNNRDSYQKFFSNLPDRTKILASENSLIEDLNKSILKNKHIVLNWQDIALMYRKAIVETLSVK